MTAVHRYSDRAVTALAAYVRAQLPTHLRALETELELTAGAIADPVEVVERMAPEDNRSPLIEVYDAGGSWAASDGYDHRIWAADCTVALSYTSDADISAGEAFVRRYATAVIRCLLASDNLGSTVIEAVLGGVGAGAHGTSTAAIRHYRTFDVSIHTDER
jgi:hypothetical protein